MNNVTTPTVTARDDDFHFSEMGDRWWMTETAWYSFCKPEIGLGGWVYTMFRPDTGTVAGGCWIWEPGAYLPHEVTYSSNLTAMPLQEDGALTDIELRTGTSIRMTEPLRTHHVGFREEGRIALDLTFDAVMPPRPMARNDGSFQELSHFDQFSRVTGRIDLRGREVDIDCLAIRDRSWGPRPEHRPGRSTYVSGIASPECCFLAGTKWNDPDYPLSNGFRTLDGRTETIVSGRRATRRDPETGLVEEITIDGRDAAGRDLHATGRRLSGIIITRHSNGLIEWENNGRKGHGEDQDMWPVHDWADMRRDQRSGVPA